MSILQTCVRCPFFHAPGEDCPKRWHEPPRMSLRAIGYGLLFSAPLWVAIAYAAGVGR